VDAKKSGALRVDAYAVSVIIRFIAFLSFVATVFVTYEAAKLGWNLGVTTTNNPFPWLIFAGGAFASLMIFAIGLALAILCAIYDRQEVKFTGPGPQLLREPPYPRLPPTTTERVVSGEAAPPSAMPPPKPPPPVVAPKYGDGELPTKERSVFWDQLTRERHLGKRPDD
jgi:hypothetical protein